jgi:putative ABC transport system permease protein
VLNGESYEVIGVMPSRVQYPVPYLEVWTPLAFSPDQLRQRQNHTLTSIARLKPGITLAAAQSEMNVISSRMAAADEQNKGWGAEIYPMMEIEVGGSRRMLLTLMASVGFVLLIACVNIANLLLARTAARGKEIAVRIALGAGRARIILQLLIESLVLSMFGGLAGILLAQLGLMLMLRFSPPDLPRVAEGVQLDLRTLAFTLAVSLLAGILFGLAPACQVSRHGPAQEMNEASRGNSVGRNRRHLRGILIVSEVALSLLLLIGAGLMIRSFSRLLSQNPGFQTENIVTIPFSLPNRDYPNEAKRTGFFEQLHARVASMPGVDSAALVYGLPLGVEYFAISVEVAGAAPLHQSESGAAGYSQISPGYFKTMRIPLLLGRDFSRQDTSATGPVLIVDETFARHFNLGNNPIGRRINIGDGIGDGTTGAEIVGVVKDVKRQDLTAAPKGEVYRPYLQRCWGYMNLTVRTRRPPSEIARTVRSELDQLDKNLPVEHVRTMSQLLDTAVASQRLSARLLGGFAGVALLMVTVGLYGVLAFDVSQRSREIGIRMALGAQRMEVQASVITQGLKLTLIGVGVGLAGALILTQLLKGFLYEVQPTDPLTFAAVSTLLILVASLACWLPARRASRVDPMSALRCE